MRETRKQLTAAVQAAGTSRTGPFAVAPLVLAALLHLVLIVTGDIVRVGVTVAAAVLAWRWRKRKTGAARVMPPLRQKMARAASPLRRRGAPTPYPAKPHVNYRRPSFALSRRERRGRH